RVRSVAFSPDGHTLASTGDDKNTILWDLTDPAKPNQIGRPLTGHTGPVNSVAFSPDGHTLITGSDDKTAILWDLTDPTSPIRIGQPLTGPINSVAFSPDGHTVATAGFDQTVVLWDLAALNTERDHIIDRACAMAGGGPTTEEWSSIVPGVQYQK